MSAKHTPGPWRLCGAFGMQSLIEPAAGGHPVAAVTGYYHHAGNTEANARLIAAAPDLLAACINARDMLSTDRQAFIDCHRLRDSRTDDAIAHGLVWVDEETWIEPGAADPLRDYDRAIALIDAAMVKAAGEAA